MIGSMAGILERLTVWQTWVQEVQKTSDFGWSSRLALEVLRQLQRVGGVATGQTQTPGLIFRNG